MRATEIQPGDCVLDEGMVHEVTWPVQENGKPMYVRVDGEDYTMTIPANWDIPVVKGEGHER